MDYVEYQTPTEIYLGDNTVIHALGEGLVKLLYNVELHKVLYVPKHAKNLLSVPAMIAMETKVQFDGNDCIVSKNNKDYVIGELTDGMLHTVKDPEYSQSSIDTSSQIWHQRLGHLNHDYIKKMMKKNMVKGMRMAEMRKLQTIVKDALAERCTEILLLKQVNTELLKHMKLSTVMYVTPCKLNRREADDIW